MLERALAADGFVVEEASDGERALAGARPAPDVVVLDLGLPSMDGIEGLPPPAVVQRRLRDHPDLPRRGDRHAGRPRRRRRRYVRKPASGRQIVARARAMLRRPRARGADEGGAEAVRRVGDLEIDVGAREATIAGRVVGLTRIEFDLLDALTATPRMVVSRTALLEAHLGRRPVRRRPRRGRPHLEPAPQDRGGLRPHRAGRGIPAGRRQLSLDADALAALEEEMGGPGGAAEIVRMYLGLLPGRRDAVLGAGDDAARAARGARAVRSERAGRRARPRRALPHDRGSGAGRPVGAGRRARGLRRGVRAGRRRPRGDRPRLALRRVGGRAAGSRMPPHPCERRPPERAPLRAAPPSGCARMRGSGQPRRGSGEPPRLRACAVGDDGAHAERPTSDDRGLEGARRDERPDPDLPARPAPRGGGRADGRRAHPLPGRRGRARRPGRGRPLHRAALRPRPGDGARRVSPPASVAELASEGLASVAADAPLADAVRQMHEARVQHLVVVAKGSGRPVGLLSTLDILRALADLAAGARARMRPRAAASGRRARPRPAAPRPRAASARAGA